MRLMTLSALVFFWAVSAAAQTLFGQSTDYATVELHAGVPMASGQRVAALRVELSPGWKTYWRSPGDAGIPPHFDWAGSENLSAVKIEWPSPVVFNTYGSRTIGYEQRMVLPMVLTPTDPAKPIRIRLGFSYGLCREICIPAFESVALDIEPGAAEEGAYFIKTARATMPVGAGEVGLVNSTCRIEGAGAKRVLTAAFSFASPLRRAPVVVAEGPDGVWIGPMASSLHHGDLIARGPVETEAGRWIDRSSIIVTLLGDGGAAEIEGCAPTG